MNKKFTNRVIGKPVLLALLSLIVIVAGIVVAAVCGFNKAATTDDAKFLSVNLENIVYERDLDKVEELCEKVFEKTGVDYNYVQYGEMQGGNQELAYVFDKDVKLDKAVATIKASLDAAYPDNFSYVTLHTEEVQASLPTDYIVWGAVASAIAAVLAFIYVSARHNLAAGLALCVAMLFGFGLTFAAFALTRIAVTTAFTYLMPFAMLATAIMAMCTFSKINELRKTEKGKELSAKELTEESVATKEILTFATIVAVALVLVGAIATYTMRMNAISALIALLFSTFAGWLVAPAVYMPLKAAADKRAANRARYDYKKDKKSKEEG